MEKSIWYLPSKHDIAYVFTKPARKITKSTGKLKYIGKLSEVITVL